MLPNLIKNSILKSSALLKSQQYQLYYSICIKIALLKYLYFQNIFAFSYLSILVCYFLLCSYMCSLGQRLTNQVAFASSKCQFSIPSIQWAKIRYFEESNCNSGSLPPYIIIIFSNTDSKLQFTLLHQRFICY